METTFTFDGFEEVVKVLEQIPKSAKKEIYDVVSVNAEEIRTNAIKLVPVDTAMLKTRIQVKRPPESYDWTKVQVGAPIEYAAHVEFGTRPHFPPASALTSWARRHGMAGKEFVIARAISKRGTKAQPYLFPALEKQKATFLKDAKDMMKNLGRRK